MAIGRGVVSGVKVETGAIVIGVSVPSGESVVVMGDGVAPGAGVGGSVKKSAGY